MPQNTEDIITDTSPKPLEDVYNKVAKDKTCCMSHEMRTTQAVNFSVI